MIAKACVVACATIILISISPADEAEVIETAKLRLSIGRTRTPIGVGNKVLSHELFVIVQNISEAPVAIWDKWNSWGYHNLSLTLAYENGEVAKLKRFGGKDWGHNAPETIELAPGEQYVYLVWLKPNENRLFSSSWGPVDVPSGDPTTVQIQAKFEVRGGESAKREHVWVGSISSKPMSIQLTDATTR